MGLHLEMTLSGVSLSLSAHQSGSCTTLSKPLQALSYHYLCKNVINM